MACLAPMIDRSILREVKSGPYMLKAGFQKGPMELRTCPLDVSPLACVSDLPWRLVAAQHPPPYPEALKFHEIVHPLAHEGFVVVDVSKLDLRSYAGAERANTTRVKPLRPAGRLGPRKAAIRTTWSER